MAASSLNTDHGVYRELTREKGGMWGKATSRAPAQVLRLGSMDPIQVVHSYDGSTPFETLTDSANSNAFSTSYTGVDLPAILGGSTAFIGFSGGTGGGTATQR